MRLRAKCKCGAEFEAKSLTTPLLDDFRVWQAIHNTRCYGVTKWDADDDGKIHITGLPRVESKSEA